MRSFILLLSMLLVSIKTQEDIQLFHYIHPTHSEQVNYIVGIAQYMMEKREWNRQFTINENLCPQYTTEVCPDGKICRPPGEPPKQPPNICDLEHMALSSSCNPGGDCYDNGNCPIKVCDVPMHLRKEVDGIRMCTPDDCKPQEGMTLPEDCKPVTRCDLKMYEGHFDTLPECQEPDPCTVNPSLCVNECDLTGDYSPCGYMDCYQFPFLPMCMTLPPPPPCVDGQTASDNNCCVGLDCITPFDRCLWGQKIGERVVDTLTRDADYYNKSKLDKDGNPLLDCLTRYEQVEKQPLMFECFKDGVLTEGFSLVNEKKIHEIVRSNKVEGDVVVVEGDIEDTKKMSVTMTNTTEHMFDGANNSN